MGSFDVATRVRAAGAKGQDFAEVFERGPVAVAVLADGAGGTSGGEDAARSVIEAVRVVAESPRDLMDLRLWPQTLSALDAALLKSAKGGKTTAGQTTAVVIATDGKRVVGASVGDSIAWRIRLGSGVELTHGQRRKPLLGGRAPPADSWAEAVAPGDVLLLATDGLWKYAPLQRIFVLAGGPRSATERVERLVQLPALPSGALQDDVGVALVQIR